MLPFEDIGVIGHSGGHDDGAAILTEFRKRNPQLVPMRWDGRGVFCRQLWHLLFLNHREYSTGLLPECCYNDDLSASVTDHRELWQDRETLDLVQIAHSRSDGSDEGFLRSVSVLSERGLSSGMSDSSWYSPRTNLMVVARPRTFDRMSFDPDTVVHVVDVDEWDAMRAEAVRRALEDVDYEKWLWEASEAESGGDYERAVLLFVDAVHTERTGRFHRHAVHCMREAARLLREHYPEVVLMVAARGFLTRSEVRGIFRYAGVEVPGWLERMWRNGSRVGPDVYRIEVGEQGTVEYHRCVVCEEWLGPDCQVPDMNNGYMHLDRRCLKQAAAAPPVFLS